MSQQDRESHRKAIERLLRGFPVVAILGPRQVGKTTLAREIARSRAGKVTIFDLENPRDVARLTDPMLTLATYRGLVVLDEIQLRPELFGVLRVLADRRPLSCRFLILGSATPDLLRQGAESLAGRIAFHELPPFSLGDVGTDHLDRLWRRGGFPCSYLARSEAQSVEWRRNFIRMFIERDLPQLGVTIPAATLRRFWQMLAHLHGNVLNSSELARSFGVADTTVRRYIETLESTFVVRTLRPYHMNIAKRQVKAPKVYVTDSGVLHTLLDIATVRDLEGHPKLGASWEGFLIESVISALRVPRERCYFWATHAGAELDLLVLAGSKRLGFEFKRTSAPTVTPSMRSALHDLELDRLDVVYAGDEPFQMAERIRAVPAHDVIHVKM